ncbi:HD domain-containing protein [Hyphobacterium sp. CCMP332]|nr:HD domain-containing protein [Hyphobacterium sp. CCMP332]
MNFSSKLNQDAIFQTISDCAEDLKFETYVVGGFPRDLILDRNCTDLDFVCVGSGIDLAKAVKSKLKGSSKVQIYKNFGTAKINWKNFDLEFVGARKESYDRNSRNPVVEDGSLEDDQNRRDFTINAMAISLNTSDYGELIDPFKGLDDLKRKIIKTPLDPEITFSDDPLRMMRAVRFASQLNFDIASDTFEGIINNKNRISIVSFERVSVELNKIIESPKPSYGFKLLDSCGLLELIFPEMIALKGTETKKGKSHKDNFYHTLQVLDNVAKNTDNLWLRWAAILHDIAKPATKRFDKNAGWTFHGHEDLGSRMVPGIFRKLKLPLNEKMKYVQKLVRLHLRPIPLVRDEISDSALRRLLFEAGDDIDDLLALCRADITSKNESRKKRYLNNLDIVSEKLKEVEEKDKLRNFQPPISGQDIMKTFNIGPSPEIGKIKTAVREAILDGEIQNNKQEALKLMYKLGNELGLKSHVQE